MADSAKQRTGPAIDVVPANDASWDDLQAILGPRGDPHFCQCQGLKIQAGDWRSVPLEERAARFREQTNCGDPAADATTGLVAYLDGEAAGWCAVEPRTAYQRLLRTRVPWLGRTEDQADSSVWSVTCFVTRKEFRRMGVTRALAAASVDFARERGARVLEAYPMLTEPGKEIIWGELHVGSRSVFEAAGFHEVSRPTIRRVVMRLEL